MDKLIGNYNPAPFKTVGGDLKYGVEIEVEQPTCGAATLCELAGPAGTWDVHNDGSLRGGFEFVSKPMREDQTEATLRRMYEGTGGKWSASLRTGIHIHVNMLGRTTGEVLRLLQYYALFEPVLFAQVGDVREENIYCVPYYRAPEEVDIIRNALTHRWAWINQTCKYSGLYVGPLATYGTIEFRHAPTWTNIEDLIHWYRSVKAIVHTYDQPPVSTLMRDIGLDGIVARVFGEHEEVIRNFVPDIRALVAKEGSEEISALLEPLTFKNAQWGRPAEFRVAPRAVPPADAQHDVLNRAGWIIDPPRIRDPESELDEDDFEVTTEDGEWYTPGNPEIQAAVQRLRTAVGTTRTPRRRG